MECNRCATVCVDLDFGILCGSWEGLVGGGMSGLGWVQTFEPHLPYDRLIRNRSVGLTQYDVST